MEDKPKLDLREFQAEVLSWHLEHFGAIPLHEILDKAAEELRELDRAVAELSADGFGYVTDPDDIEPASRGWALAVAFEALDVLVPITAVLGRLGIDLEAAFFEKWEIVKARPADRVARPSYGDAPEQWLPSASEQELDAER